MPILRYENLNHLELSAVPRDKTVIFMGVGPLEEHGPHLPLGTDALTARFFSERMAARLADTRGGWTFVLFPTIYAGSDTLTYTGSIEIKPALLRALLLQNCKQLARDGFRNIIAFSTHGGPRHMVVLEEVAARMKWRHRARMISASARILGDVLHGRFVERLAVRMEKNGTPLTDDERQALKTDYHGGMLETSIMLLAHPELVQASYKTLRPAIVEGGFWKLRRSSGKKIGEGLGHLGSPALARPELGQAAIEALVDDTLPSIERFLDGENVDKLFRSKFYFVPFFRTDFKVLLLLIIYPIVLGLMWYSMSRAMVGIFQ